MGFNPNTGMTPNDWVETEARREERVQRAGSPHGQEISPRSRRVTAWILGLAALALVAYAVLGWLGMVSVPGFGA
jgi:type VI protein secretion system component VasF